ncbi:hypothetical protein K1T71_014948 [Dendrolimus kikuchii]|nr:hypothetical protein K1T71_014948 [Dendrolimus kikuchii]
MSGMLEETGLQILNTGSTPTFDTVRGNKAYTSFVDITASCRENIQETKTQNKIRMPWWSDELYRMKKRVTTLKKRVKWAAAARKERVIRDFLQAKEEYKKAAKDAQIHSWKEFCSKQDCEGDDEEEDNEYHRQVRIRAQRINEEDSHVEDDPPFTVSELKNAMKSFNPKKAPGEDGITSDICAHAVIKAPELFLSLANKCLELGYFPTEWKKATVVILRKPGKTVYNTAKSYRPIGLLPVIGKLFEKLIVARLRWHLVPRLSSRQYGFLPQRSTEDSLYDLMNHIRAKLTEKKLVTLVSLDIEGAFDSAW